MQEFKKWLKDSDYVTIKVVDGHDIRQNKDVDYIGGGHHWVYTFIPKREVWLENLTPKIERKYILIHEMIERMLMRYLHMPYAKAHDIANELEHKVRQGSKPDDIFTTFINKYFSKDDDKLQALIHSYNDFKG